MVMGTCRTGRAAVKWWVDTQVYFVLWWGLVGWLVSLERVRGRTRRKMGWIVVR